MIVFNYSLLLNLEIRSWCACQDFKVGLAYFRFCQVFNRTFRTGKNISTELCRRCQTRIATSTPQGSQDGCLSWSPIWHSRTFSRGLPRIAHSSTNKAAQYAFSRQHRKKGMISMSTYLRPYKYGSRSPYEETTATNKLPKQSR